MLQRVSSIPSSSSFSSSSLRHHLSLLHPNQLPQQQQNNFQAAMNSSRVQSNSKPRLINIRSFSTKFHQNKAAIRFSVLSSSFNFSSHRLQSTRLSSHNSTYLPSLQLRNCSIITRRYSKDSKPAFHEHTTTGALQLSPEYSALLQRIHKAGTIERIMYWGAFAGMSTAGSVISELILSNYFNTPGFGVTFLSINFLATAAQYLVLRVSNAFVASSMGGQEVTENDPDPRVRYFVHTVQQLSQVAGLPLTPRTFIMPTDEKNAFAAGFSPAKSIVAVTAHRQELMRRQGLLRVLDKEELRAVLAHEVGHIRNGDSRTSLHLIAMNAGFFALFRLGWQMMTGGGRVRREEDRGRSNIRTIGMVVAALGGIIAVAGLLFRLAISRRRELEADASSVAFTQDNKALASALHKIAGQSPVSNPILNDPGNRLMYGHMYFDVPAGKTLFKFFSTHPPLEQRLELLERLSRDRLKEAEKDLKLLTDSKGKKGDGWKM